MIIGDKNSILGNSEIVVITSDLLCRSAISESLSD
jgi:hypothetical protein